MRHGKKFNHLGRQTAHRKAMLSNMACSLIEHKRINTTVAKAKALRKYVEPLVTKSKDDSTHSRRVVFSYLGQKEAVTELFRDVAAKVGDRPGGYTRIIRTGNRLGDNADMCMIELVDYNEVYTKDGGTAKKKRSRRGGAKKATPAAAAATAASKSEAKVEAPKADAPKSEAPKTEASKSDDLTKVEGIGPKVQEALVAGGITTFAALAASTPEKIAGLITEVGGSHTPDTWPKQAELAAAGQWDDLKKWQDELQGGLPSDDAPAPEVK